MNQTQIEEMKKAIDVEINDEWKSEILERLSPHIPEKLKTELEQLHPELLDCVMIDYNCYNILLRLEGKLPKYVPVSEGKKYRQHLIDKGYLIPAKEVN